MWEVRLAEDKSSFCALEKLDNNQYYIKTIAAVDMNYCLGPAGQSFSVE